MDTALILGIAGAVCTATATIMGARYAARRASKDEIAAAVAEQAKPIAEQSKAAADRAAAVDRAMADLKEDVAALGSDVDGLRAALQAHLTDESSRRHDAREAAVKRDLEVVQRLTELAAGVKALDQRLRDVLDAAGGIRGLARTSQP